jgi:hypothetical protein
VESVVIPARNARVKAAGPEDVGDKVKVGVDVGTNVSVDVGSTGVWVAVGGTGEFVAVAGTAVFVRVAVGGIGVFVTVPVKV